MLVSRLRQRLAIPTALVRAIGMHTALFLLLILVVSCGGQSGTESPAPEPDPKSEPTPEAGPNKREVAIEEGSLRDLVQEQVGNFELQGVDEDTKGTREFIRRFNVDAVESLNAAYVWPGVARMELLLITMRSPEAADNFRQEIKEDVLSKSKKADEIVDERPVEASGRRVGTVTVMRTEESGKDAETGGMFWNNGNLVAIVETAEQSDAVEDFYESVPY